MRTLLYMYVCVCVCVYVCVCVCDMCVWCILCVCVCFWGHTVNFTQIAMPSFEGLPNGLRLCPVVEIVTVNVIICYRVIVWEVAIIKWLENKSLADKKQWRDMTVQSLCSHPMVCVCVCVCMCVCMYVCVCVCMCVCVCVCVCVMCVCMCMYVYVCV